MAWSNATSKIGAACIVWQLVGVAAVSGGALAQSDLTVQETPLSNHCQTPGLKLALDKPLPNTLTAMKERKLIKILTIGSSSSVGMDAGGDGYQDVIKEKLEHTVAGLDVEIIDRGISGELAHNAALRLKKEVAFTEPDLVLWQVGSNDALAQVPSEEFKETVTETVNWLREHNVDVVLVGMHYIRNLRNDPHYQAIRAVLTQLADSEKLLRISRYEALDVMEQMRERSSQAPLNAFEITEEDYSCFAEYVVRGITSAIFLKRGKANPTN